MAGTVCLQGGAEFAAACRPMDADLLARAGGGPVAIWPLAAAPGLPYRLAGGNGARHFTALGATSADVVPDPRTDPGGVTAAADVLAGARLLVLPGGSPSRLLEALTEPAAGSAVRQVLERDGVLIGASAGAMVLCDATVLPEGSGPRGPLVVPGLGVVPDAVVLPHYRGDRGWASAVRRQVARPLTLLGLPECAGLLVTEDRWTAVGAAPTTLILADGGERVLAVGQSVSPEQLRP